MTSFVFYLLTIFILSTVTTAPLVLFDHFFIRPLMGKDSE